MADLTNIEWCDATLNLWWGCTKASDGCRNCYALDLDNRYHPNDSAWGPTGSRREVKSWRATLNKISNRAKAENRRLRVFCQSMSDTFEGPETMGGYASENWRLVHSLRRELLGAILLHKELDFLLLTKRPENVTRLMWEYSGNLARGPWARNLWIGTSVEDQKTADERIPHLLKIPAAVRFLSCEPLIGDVTLDKWLYDRCNRCNGTGGYYDCADGGQGDEDCRECEGLGVDYGLTLDEIHWVICGGESGRNARPMNPDWARSLRDQCRSAGVPFFFKQWGEWVPDDEGCALHGATVPNHVAVEYPFAEWDGDPETGEGNWFGDVTPMLKIGKKRAGRMLDGREWSEFPKVAS